MKLPRLSDSKNILHQLNPLKWDCRYLLLAFLLPFLGIVAVQIVGKYEPFFDGRALLYSDEYHQYFPFFLSFRRAILNGDGLLWNWDVGLGMDFLGLYAYYLASPLNWLAILLPEAWALEYFALLMPIKLGLAGLFFAIFLKGIFDKNDFSIAVFGMFYATCAFALAYQWNIMWLDSFALLPLVVLGMVKLLKDKKFILYTVALFLAFISNYYIGYIICLFIFLLFFCYEICRFPGVKRFFADLGRIALFSVLALGMTLVITLPGLMSLQQTQSSDNSLLEGPIISDSGVITDQKPIETTKSGMEAILETFGMNICGPYEYDYYERYHEDYSKAEAAWNAIRTAQKNDTLTLTHYTDYIQACVPLLNTAMARIAGNLCGGQKLGLMEGLPNVYCGIATIFLAFLFLTAPQVKLRDKLCAIFLVLFIMLSFIIRQLDYIWHGFHFTNMIPYRFSFLLSFVLLYMAYRAWTLKHKMKIWQLTLAGILSLGIVACSDNREDVVFLAYNVFFLALTFIILLLSRLEHMLPTENERAQIPRTLVKRHREMISIVLVGVLVMELAMNIVSFGTQFPYTDIVDYPNSPQSSANAIAVMKEQEKDSPFYRTEVTHSQTLNDGSLNGYYGISTFSSSANRRVTKFLQNLGQAALPEWNRYCYEDSSPVANLFLNLKYLIERDYPVGQNQYFDKVYTDGEVTLLKNNMYLPLGFLAEPALASLRLDQIYNAFTKQNRLFTAATGVLEDVWVPLDESCLVISSTGATLTSQTPNGYSTYQTDGNSGTVHYTYNIDREGFMCLNLSFSADCSYAIYVNGELVQFDYVNLDQMAAVGTVYPGDTVDLDIYVNANEYGTLTITNSLIDDEVFRRGYEILNAGAMEITKFTSTRIEGVVNCDRTGVLYTSIPDTGSWTVLVDGKAAPIASICNAMVGVMLTEGQHTITFVYHNQSFIYGLLISIACLLIFITLILLQRSGIFRSKSQPDAQTITPILDYASDVPELDLTTVSESDIVFVDEPMVLEDIPALETEEQEN